MKRRVIVTAVIILLLAGAAVYGYTQVYGQSNPCIPLGGANEVRSSVSNTTFAAITEYALPNPGRMPNGIASAPDGSVWFGETSVPGVGHLMLNGTLVEYAWPLSPKSEVEGACEYKTGIWGVAIWNNMVWGTSYDSNQIFGLIPGNDTVRSLSAPEPNTLTVGPDGNLWFTIQSYGGASIGRISSGDTVQTFKILNYPHFIPQEIQFVNSSYAYYAGLNPVDQKPYLYKGGIFSFNPDNVSSGITATMIGSDYNLVATTSLSASDGLIWTAQHEVSSIIGLNVSSGAWMLYPTSVNNFTAVDSTLPYFVRANGSLVWFSEHYANKIALLDTMAGTLTEYSEANPPIYNLTEIQNDLTIALVPKGLWFTSDSGNYIGFASGTYKPTFAIAAEGSNKVELAPGAKTALLFKISGGWTGELSVQFSDSEKGTSVPSKIALSANATTLASQDTGRTIQVGIAADGGIAPGAYTVAVTVSDGLVSQTAYLFVTVT